MKIQVTEVHLKKGIRCNPHWCPVALAFMDAGLRNVSVGPNMMSFKYWNKDKEGCISAFEQTHILPNEMIDFIHKFDNKIPVDPTEFDMEIT